MDELLHEVMHLEAQHTTAIEDYRDSLRQREGYRRPFEEMDEDIQLTFKYYQGRLAARCEMRKKLQKIEEVEERGDTEEAARRAQQQRLPRRRLAGKTSVGNSDPIVS